MRHIGARLFALGLAACGASVPDVTLVPLTAATIPEQTRARDANLGASLASRPELRIAIVAPSSAPYVPSAAGPASPGVVLEVANDGRVPANVEAMHVSFTATREEVAFPCREHAGGALHDREPGWLEPGARFKYERPLDCAMPALGRYEVVVFVRFGDNATEPVERAGAFALDVLASGPASPRPLPGRPEVQAALAGDGAVRPLPAYAWKRGDFNVMALFVNTSRAPVTLPPMRAALKVFSKARPLDCAPALLETPIDAVTLRPGRPRAFALPVRCDLEQQGDYEIGASLATSDAGPFELGRIRLRVKDEPDVTRLPEEQMPRDWLH
jgi:hypothetical protein